MAANAYRVYVLRNVAGKFYIGLSARPEIRLAQHKQGVSHWTRGRGPWELVWQSEAMNLSSARELENLLKRQKGGEGFFKMTGLHRSSGS